MSRSPSRMPAQRAAAVDGRLRRDRRHRRHAVRPAVQRLRHRPGDPPALGGSAIRCASKSSGISGGGKCSTSTGPTASASACRPTASPPPTRFTFPSIREHPVAVEFNLDSHDVIHSFWVPSLHGKKDLVPGHPTDIWLRADQPGTSTGASAPNTAATSTRRCASRSSPSRWSSSRRGSTRSGRPAPEPANDRADAGPAGVPARLVRDVPRDPGHDAARAGRAGPDARRQPQMLAAGAIPNVPGHLAGWIVDPQQIKPGARMPQNNLSPDDLRALLEYLETLEVT